jgi:outer membrane immunogenic protein
MHKLLIRSVALAAFLAEPAGAADVAVPVYQPPRPVVYLPFSWEGCYLGVNAGWATQRIDNTLSVTNGDVPVFLPADLPIINASGTVGLQTNGFTGGVQGGCNIQMNSFVWGFEGDVNYLRQEDQFSGTFLTSTGNPYFITISSARTGSPQCERVSASPPINGTFT